MTTRQTVALERTDCGSYCTPDERFWVQRIVEERGNRLVFTRRWIITDALGEFTFDAPVLYIKGAEEAIANALL